MLEVVVEELWNKKNWVRTILKRTQAVTLSRTHAGGYRLAERLVQPKPKSPFFKSENCMLAKRIGYRIGDSEHRRLDF